MVEAKKLAFADREAYVADPEYLDIPIAGLLSKEYAKERAKLIDPERAAADVAAGDPWRHQGAAGKRRGTLATTGVGGAEEDTTCFAVVDRWGNAVCQLQSIQSAWGSSLIAGDTGILLNNRMTYWHLEEDHVDCLQPGRRVRHTMNPVMVFRPSNPGSANGASDGSAPGRLAMVCGTPGADTQVQTNMQVITPVLDFGMTVAEAVEAPAGATPTAPPSPLSPIPLPMNSTWKAASRRKHGPNLEKRGHALNVMGAWEASGSEVMIWVDPDNGGLHGASDPRRDGYSVGW